MESQYIYNEDDKAFHFHHQITAQPNDGDFPIHIHDFYEMLCFVSGDAHYLVEGVEYPLTPGCMLIMRDAESHKLKIMSPEVYERYVFQFSPMTVLKTDPSGELLRAFCERPAGQMNLYLPEFFSEGRTPIDFFSRMESTDKNDTSRRLNIICNILPLLNEVKNIFTQSIDGDVGENVLSLAAFDCTDGNRIVAFVNEHLFDEGLSLQMVCNQFFMSTSQLCRNFKRATGTGLWDYVIIKRLLAARGMIRAGMTPGKAASKCGFKDYSSFYRSYISKFNEPPKQGKKSGWS